MGYSPREFLKLSISWLSCGAFEYFHILVAIFLQQNYNYFLTGRFTFGEGTSETALSCAVIIIKYCGLISYIDESGNAYGHPTYPYEILSWHRECIDERPGILAISLGQAITL